MKKNGNHGAKRKTQAGSPSRPSKAETGKSPKKPRGKSTIGNSPASAQKTRLEQELAEAIGQIDEEGLLFLLQQAQVLIHNAQVERINREMEELQQRQGAKRGVAAAVRTNQRAPAGGAGAAVKIDEADNRKSFFLDLNGVRKAVSLQEMQRLVRICYTAESKSAALRQLYTVFARERGDILADARIGGPSSALLDSLFYALREKYHLEDR